MAAKVSVLLLFLTCLFLVSTVLAESEVSWMQGKTPATSLQGKTATHDLTEKDTTIGYGAFGGDTVPCDPKDKKNCHGHEQANPYRRPCSQGNDCDRQGGSE
ncbi:hypothetical protein MRB53_022448 [Persea americana]|uniref:Uncharacterized protein n=1 Tax=Persea americana TaxID=3435 RepID=A0ACC2L6Z7_PERAE|nr:hypothetical protein MRB53_022448 [Persea americana]